MGFRRVFVKDCRNTFPTNKALIVALSQEDKHIGLRQVEAILRTLARPSVKELLEQTNLMREKCKASLKAAALRKKLYREGVTLEEVQEAFPENDTLQAAVETGDHESAVSLLRVEEELSPRALQDVAERQAEICSRAVVAKGLLERLPSAWWDGKEPPLSEIPESTPSNALTGVPEAPGEPTLPPDQMFQRPNS